MRSTRRTKNLPSVANIEAEREQQEEERAKAEGNNAELAEKRLRRLQKIEQELQQERNDRLREKRLNMWHEGASGVVKAKRHAHRFHAYYLKMNSQALRTRRDAETSRRVW